MSHTIWHTIITRVQAAGATIMANKATHGGVGLAGLLVGWVFG